MSGFGVLAGSVLTVTEKQTTYGEKWNAARHHFVISVQVVCAGCVHIKPVIKLDIIDVSYLFLCGFSHPAVMRQQ